MERKVDFVINSQEKIQFIFVLESEEKRCFDEVDIIYINSAQNISILLCKNLEVFMALWGLQGKLEAVLKNDLELPKSIIKKDIGYLSNQFEQEGYDADLEYVPLAGSKYWIGDKYSFQWWGVCGVSSWMYQKNGKIMLEITPDYMVGIEHPTYQEFMANYKPLVIVELSPKTVRAWHAQADHLSKELNCDCCR